MKNFQVIYDPLKTDTRCPLVYLLLGLLVGLPIGALLNHTSPLPWVIGAIISGLAATIHTYRSPVHSWAGGSLLLLSALLFSIGYATHRIPQPPGGPLMPPREAEIEIRIERLFNSQRPDRVSGIAVIEDAPHFAAVAIGRRVFFSTLCPPGQKSTLLPSCRLQLTGVWTRLDPKTELDFEKFLLRQHIFWTFTRCRVDTISREPLLWRRAAARISLMMQGSLAAGACDHDRTAADILQAIMLGRKDLLGGDLRSDLTVAGVMHLFAVSGLHIGIITVTLYAMLGLCGLSLRLQRLGALIAVTIFIAAIGLPPSAIRAGLFLLCFAIATFLRRGKARSNALVTSAIVVLLWEPGQLRHPGFQLSYSVVCGIFLYSLPLQRLLHLRLNTDQIYPFFSLRLSLRRHIFRRLVNYGSLSLGAGFSSAALVAGFFGTYSIGSMPLNMVVVPLAGKTVILGTMSIITGFIPPLLPVTELINAVNYTLIHWITTMIRDTSELPLLFSQGPPPPDGMILAIQVVYLGTLFAMTPILSRSYSLLPFAVPPTVVVTALAIGWYTG